MLSLFEHTESKKASSLVEVLKRKELQRTIIEYRKDGIIHVVYKSGCTLSVDDCYALAKFIARIGEAEKYPLLTEPSSGSNIDEDARVLLAGEKGNRFILKNAILCDSIVHEMIGNFFIRMDRPLTPTKLFESEVKAISWLLSNSKHD